MTSDAFEQVYYPKYQGVIRAIARKLGQQNVPLVEDLVQEGLIALWELDPSTAKKNPDAFVRQAVKFRMIDYIRKERPALYTSLTAQLDRGEQVIYDEDTNETRVVGTPSNRRRCRPVDDDDSRAAVLREERDD